MRAVRVSSWLSFFRLSASRPHPAAVALTFALGLTACFSPVAAGLDDGEANRAVAALEAAGIDGRKESETGENGRFRIVVSEGEASRALATLAEEGLPRPKSVGLLDAVGKNALVPTMAAEQAELSAGFAGELEKTFSQIDGVVIARVHVSLPSASPLREKRDKATASVVLTYHPSAGGGPPISESNVKRIVAAAVLDLSPDDVVVVALPRPARAGASRGRDGALAHVGPLGVAAGSANSLRLVLAALVLLVGLLAAASLVLYVRLARLRGARA